MAEKSNQFVPRLCIRNCGFYSNSSTNDMCSKCYKEYKNLLKNQNNQSKSNSKSNAKSNAVKDEHKEFLIAKKNSQDKALFGSIEQNSTSKSEATAAGILSWHQKQLLGIMKPKLQQISNMHDIIRYGENSDSSNESEVIINNTSDNEHFSYNKPTSESDRTNSVFKSHPVSVEMREYTVDSFIEKKGSSKTSAACDHEQQYNKLKMKDEVLIKSSQMLKITAISIDGKCLDYKTPNNEQICNAGYGGPRGKKRRRCDAENCNKKIEVIAFDCRCGKKFCNVHRYPKEHQCAFDYKQLGAEQISKALPKCIADKVRKI